MRMRLRLPTSAPRSRQPWRWIRYTSRIANRLTHLTQPKFALPSTDCFSSWKIRRPTTPTALRLPSTAATTEELLRRAGRVTSLEYDPGFVSRLAEKHRDKGSRVTVVRGDAAALPFPDHSFSSVVAVLVLHHLRSREQQDFAFQEFHRV